MKLQRHRRDRHSARSYEFGEGSLRVEVSGGRVLIESVGKTFLPRQKAAFLAYLTAEGFIPKGYDAIWINGKAARIVEWRTREAKPARSLKKAKTGKQANGFMVRLLACAAVVWIIELLALLFRASK
jgi:hypothetical protein